MSFLTLGLSARIPRIAGSSESRRLFCKVGQVAEGDGLGLVACRDLTFGGEGKAAMLTERRTSLPGKPSADVAVDVDCSVGTAGVDLELSPFVGLPSFTGREGVLWAILEAG